MRSKLFRRSSFVLACTCALGAGTRAIPMSSDEPTSLAGSCVTQTVYVGNPPLQVTVCTPWV